METSPASTRIPLAVPGLRQPFGALEPIARRNAKSAQPSLKTLDRAVAPSAGDAEAFVVRTCKPLE
jgi:hypothetical protein